MVLYHHRDTEDTENKEIEMQLTSVLSTLVINLIPAFLLCVLCASVVKVNQPARDEGEEYAST